jgi:DNA-binding NarL/FixJ family response regulator
MPNLRGIEAIREIKAIHPELKTLILTVHKDKEYLHQAISAGADEYLLKEDEDTELFSAIETIREGKIYVPPNWQTIWWTNGPKYTAETAELFPNRNG